MQYGENHYRVFRDQEVDGVRKRVQQSTSHVRRDERKLQGADAQPIEQFIGRVEEPEAQAGALVLVPRRRPLDVGLCERSDDPPTRYDSLGLTQLFSKPIPHDIPALASIGVCVVVFQAFVQHCSVPIRYRHLLGCCSNAFPQQLHVIDLLFDRELVESRRWDGNRLGHGSRPAQDQSQV